MVKEKRRIQRISVVILSFIIVAGLFEGSLQPASAARFTTKYESSSLVPYTNSSATIKEQKKISVSSHSISDKPLITEREIVEEYSEEYVSDLYAYLTELGKTEKIIVGHQNDTINKSGERKAELTNSDILDITGSLPGVVEIDTLALTGTDLGTPDMTMKKRVELCTKITKEAADQGAVISLSAHMPNFQIIKERLESEGYLSDRSINFSGSTSTILTGNIVERIVPGGDLNSIYLSYLDLIAAYAKECEKYGIPILFRPFEENTGTSYWWGAPYCDNEEFITLYRYTVDYLREEHHITNMLYVYSPGSEAVIASDYLSRYPGDDFVDIAGVEIKGTIASKSDQRFLTDFINQIRVAGNFAKDHNKVFAITEIGLSYDSNLGNDKKEIQDISHLEKEEWYDKILQVASQSDVSYLCFSENSEENHIFAVPYVVEKNGNGTLYGHKMIDSFIQFYNDDRTIFAKQMGDYKALSTTTIPIDKRGYFYAPLSGSRISSPGIISAHVKVKEPAEVVYLRIKDSNNNSTLYYEDITKEPGTKLSEGKVDVAITQELLNMLGKRSVTMTLLIVDKEICSINLQLNMEIEKKDYYIADDFEHYEGEDYQLSQAWIPIKTPENSIHTKLITKEDGFSKMDGDYAMFLQYSLYKDGYSGITKYLKGVDWSKENALQFLTQPDGKKQDVLIQLVTEEGVFEVNLNDYKEYSGKKNTMLITIPFTAFKGRDNEVTKLNSSKVVSIRILVRANGSTLYPIIATSYYDDIKAVVSKVSEISFLEK